MKRLMKKGKVWIILISIIILALFTLGLIDLVRSGSAGLIAAIIIMGAFLIGLAILSERFLVPWIIIWLGNQDRWWSPYRTHAPPGEMYIMVKGDPDGPFAGVIESVLDFRFDDEKHTFIKTPGYTREEGYYENIGVTWVGFWRYFLWREVRYDKWEKLENSTEWGLVPKIRGVKEKGGSPSIFFQYNMGTEIKAAETVGNFPVNGTIIFTSQIINPVKALFFAGGWEVQTNAAVQSVFREYVAKKDIENLREEVRRSELGTSTLISLIKAASEGEDGLLEQFGIRIIDARFVQFDLVTGDSEMTRAVRIKEIKKQEALGRINTAKGERRAKQIEAEGIAADYAARSSVDGWQTLELADALRKTSLTALGGDIMTAINPKERKKEETK